MKKVFLSLVMLTSFVCGNALATSVVCEGEVKKIKVFSDGFLLFWGNGGWINGAHRVCKMDGSWEGVSTETCKSYQSIFQHAMSSKAIIRVEYKNPVDITACNQVPSWGNSIKPHGIEME